MKEETITWHAFPKALPTALKSGSRIMFKREGRDAEFGILDKGKIYLDCNGVNGGTMIDLSEVLFIASRPKGP